MFQGDFGVGVVVSALLSGAGGLAGQLPAAATEDVA